MAWQTGIFGSTDSNAAKTVQGPSLIHTGPFFVQSKENASYNTSTTETSLFTAGTSTNIGLSTYVGSQGASVGSRVLPAESLIAGTIIRGVMRGVMQTDGTPNLTLKSYLGSTAICATAVTACTATAANSPFTIEWEYQVYTESKTAGIIKGFLKISYGVTGVEILAPFASSTSFNTTLGYAIDLTATWGTSHANNILLPTYSKISIEG